MLATGCLGQPTSNVLHGGAGGKVDARAQEAAVGSVARVHAKLCDGSASGSAFVVDQHTLVTNKHVVEGAQTLSLDLPDGRSGVPVEATDVDPDEDLAVLHADADLPAPLSLDLQDPIPGDLVEAVGYPLGGPLTPAPGRVIDYTDGTRFQHVGQLLRTSVAIRPGNSGGPLLDRSGAVAGVVFAVQYADGEALVIPATRLRARLAEADGFTPLEAGCGGA